MESGLVRRGLNFTRRKKKWIILLGMVGFSSFCMFKLYHLPWVARKRKRTVKLVASLISLAEMVSDSAETVSLVSKDLKEFLKSESHEIPNSLRQLSKIVRSQEFSQSMISVSQAMTAGILRGYNAENGSVVIKEDDKFNLSDRIMDKLTSSAGTGFVSVVVGSFAKNLVLGVYASSGWGEELSENGHSSAPYMKSSSTTTWFDVLSNDKCQELVADSIKTFVGTAVAVYLEKTMEVNFYDDMFSGLTNPKHQSNMKDIMVSLCNGMVETLVKTSHHVLTSARSDSCSISDYNEVSSLKQRKNFEQEACLEEVKQMNGSIDVDENKGWISSVSSTLAEPNNRKFVLDVTGRVTFETVRSVIEVFLHALFEGLKRSFNVVQDKVLDRGLEVVRYFGSKSSVILTLCVMFFLHVTENTRVMLPA